MDIFSLSFLVFPKPEPRAEMSNSRITGSDRAFYKAGRKDSPGVAEDGD